MISRLVTDQFERRPRFEDPFQKCVMERGTRFEAPVQKCVMGTLNSAETLPERHRSTSGFGILARVVERLDFFLPVYNAAPLVTATGFEGLKCPSGVHRRVRFFSAGSGLATKGSNFYARESRPRLTPEGTNFNAQNLEPFQFGPTEARVLAECADLVFLLQRRKGEEATKNI